MALRPLLSAILGLGMAAVHAQEPVLQWGRNFGGINGEGYARIGAVELMADGGIAQGGWFSGTVDLDSDANGQALFTAMGSSDGYVQVLDAAGNFTWGVAFGSAEDLKVLDVASDAQGNVFATLKFQGSIDIDPGPGTVMISASGVVEEVRDLVLLKLDAQGNYAVHRQFASTSYEFQSAAVEMDLNDRPVLAYNVDGDLIRTLTLANDDLANVAEFTFGNNGGSGQAVLLDFDRDTGGNLLYTGYYSQQISLDPNDPLALTETDGNNLDLFFSKLSATGTFVFGHGMGSGSNSEKGYAITSGPDGAVHVSGVFAETMDVDPGPGVVEVVSEGGVDMFLLTLDANGSFQRVARIGGPDNEFGYELAVDPTGIISWTGYLNATTDVDPGDGVQLLPISSSSSIVLQLDPQGEFLWARRLGAGTLANNAVGVRAYADGSILLAGSFSGAALDRDPSEAVDNLLASEGAAGFDLKWGFCTALTPSISISASQDPLCPGAEVTFTASTANGGDAPSYTWTVNGSNVGPNAATYTTSALVLGDLVQCTLLSNADCAAPASVQSNVLPVDCEVPTVGLFFSEYIEGSGNNKALELFNPLTVAVDLGDYAVLLYANGSATPTSTLQLSGSLEGGAVYVVANSQAAAEVLAVADITSGVCSFNGNDAVVLQYQGEASDIIGEVGVDPGTNWPIPSGGATSEFTLRRNADVTGPETVWAIGSTQWTASPQDSFEDLGIGIPTAVQQAVLPAMGIAPNPTSTQFRLLGTVPVHLRILSLSGALVTDLGITQPGTAVDVSRLEAGLYLLELNGEARNVVKLLVR